MSSPFNSIPDFARISANRPEPQLMQPVDWSRPVIPEAVGSDIEFTDAGGRRLTVHLTRFEESLGRRFAFHGYTVGERSQRRVDGEWDSRFQAMELRVRAW